MQLSTGINPVYAQFVRLSLVLVNARHGLRAAQKFSDSARERAAMLRLSAEETVASNEKVMAGLRARHAITLVTPATAAPSVKRHRHHRAAGVVRCGACGRGIRKAVQMTVERGTFVHTTC